MQKKARLHRRIASLWCSSLLLGSLLPAGSFLVTCSVSAQEAPVPGDPPALPEPSPEGSAVPDEAPPLEVLPPVEDAGPTEMQEALLQPLEPGEVTEATIRLLASKAGFGLGRNERALVEIGLTQGIEAAVAEFMRHKPELCNQPGDTRIPGADDNVCFDDYVQQRVDAVNGGSDGDNRRRELERLNGFRFAHSVNAYEQRMLVHLLGLFTTSLRPERVRLRAAEMNDYLDLLTTAIRGDTDLVALAKDVTKHPMMVTFLSGDGSKAPQPNENYGREFMGLMSIGVVDLDGELTYTDADVAESSRAYTGFVVEGRETRFVEENFIPGPKSLFAGTDHACTAVTADDAVECAFAHPNAPIHCATELLHSFVTPDPSRELVLELAQVCAENQLRLRPIMQVLLSSRAFYDAAHVGAVPKQCYELFAGLVRTTQAAIRPDEFSDTLARCNEGNVTSGPGALFIPIDSPTSTLTKIDVTDFAASRLSNIGNAYRGDAKSRAEKALFTDRGITLETSADLAFEACMEGTGVIDVMSPEQRQRFETLFGPEQYDAASADQRLDAMLGCYRRFLLSTEFQTR